MSRFIDADALDKRVYNDIPISVFGSIKKMAAVREIIEEQPTVDAVPRDELIKLAKKVSDMREAQKRYFKGRSINDLTVSKQLEAEVDTIVNAILDSDLTLF